MCTDTVFKKSDEVSRDRKDTTLNSSASSVNVVSVLLGCFFHVFLDKAPPVPFRSVLS